MLMEQTMALSSLSLSYNLKNPANTHIWPRKHSMQGKESTRLVFFLCECLHGISVSAQWLKKKKKNLPAHIGNTGWILGWGRSLGEGNGNSLQYSCLGNPIDRVWGAPVHGLQRIRHQRPNHKEYLHTPTAVSSLTILSLEIKLDDCCYLSFKQERLIVCVLDLLYFGAHFSILRINDWFLQICSDSCQTEILQVVTWLNVIFPFVGETLLGK